MDQSTITQLSRRGIRELIADYYSDTDIEDMTLQAIYFFGMRIKRNDPSYYHTRKSISSYTNVFSWPSDCVSVLKVWDLMTNAITITGAADNGSGGIRITSVDHGFSDDAIITQHDIVGTTEANDTFLITLVDDDNYDLDGSTFSNAYTSGGKAYVTPRNPPKMEKINLEKANLNNPRNYYLRGKTIVVDDKSFENDIIVDYDKRPSEITDIPTEYHMGLVAYNVIHLIMIPDQEKYPKEFADKTNSARIHKGIFETVIDSIEMTFVSSGDPIEFPEGSNLDNYAEDF